MDTLTLVIDSSVIIKWLSEDNENHLEEADKVLKDAQKEKVILIAPELAKYEVGNVLLFSKHLSSEQAEIILSKFYNLPISFVLESKVLAKETFIIAQRMGITYYDASFMSLAKQYNATLVTDNIKHQGKDPKVRVITLKDY